MAYRVFITRQIPNGLRQKLEKSFQQDDPDLSIYWDIWPKSSPPNKEELKAHLEQADAMISLLSDPIDDEIFQVAPKLKIVSNYAVGFNNIDLKAAQERGIFVTNTPDVLTNATADLAFTLLLNLTRKIQPARDNALQGEWRGWEPRGFLGTDLRQKTLGVIGMGRIGQEMARLCRQTFGMNILYAAASGDKHLQNAEYVPLTRLPELLASSDVLSLHCPLTADNYHLLGEKNFEHLKDEAYLINTARGELVDQRALLEHLRRDRFCGVGLDVTEPEPLPSDHALYSFERVLITPHIGSATIKAREEMANLCYENVLRALTGHELLTPLSLNA